MIPVIPTTRSENSAPFEERGYTCHMIHTHQIQYCQLTDEDSPAPLAAIVTTADGVYVTFAEYITKPRITDRDIMRLLKYTFSSGVMDFLDVEVENFEDQKWRREHPNR